MDRPDSGRLTVHGINLPALTESQLADWRAANVGFVFQFYQLIPVLTAFENVELPLLLTQLSRRERQEHVDLVLELVDLTDRQNHYPSQLSGGQQQRVAIARALVTDPTLIAADEPTGDLDKKSAGEIMDLLTRLNDDFQKTIIIVTHDPEAAAPRQPHPPPDQGAVAQRSGVAGGISVGLQSSLFLNPATSPLYPPFQRGAELAGIPLNPPLQRGI